MKKLFSVLFIFLVFGTISSANDTIIFDFPNEGWHKIQCPDSAEYKKCYLPDNQTAENYNQILTIYEKVPKNIELSAMAILQKQLGKDKNNYPDIIPEYIKKDMDDSILAWCSKYKNICTIERAFKGNNGVIMAIYTNKMPHYSQNMFGQWSNILGSIRLYTPNSNEEAPKNLIEL